MVRPQNIKGYEIQEVSYHMKLLDEAGLIKAKCQENLGKDIFCIAYALTWEGHELLDLLRNKSLWHKIVEMAKNLGISLSFGAIRVISQELLRTIVKG